MIEYQTQALLGSLLRYFHHGDYANLRKVVDKAVPRRLQSNPFVRANYTAALSIAGFIETRESDDKKEWWIAFDSDIEIRGSYPKLIPTSKREMDQGECTPRIMISDNDGNALISGFDSTKNEGQGEDYFFGKDFVNWFPPFKEIERHVCREEAYNQNLIEAAKIYDWEVGAWRESSGNVHRPCLIQVCHEFGGLRHYIVYPALKLQFRVFKPEWVFLAAINLPGVCDVRPIKVTSDSVLLPRNFRVPTLLLRFLFASSESLRIGTHLYFSGTAPFAINVFTKIFSQGEQRGI